MNEIYTDLEGAPWRWEDERKGELPHEDFYQAKQISEEYHQLAKLPHMYSTAVQGRWYFASRLKFVKDSVEETVELLRTETKTLDQLTRMEPVFKEKWDEENELP